MGLPEVAYRDYEQRGGSLGEDAFAASLRAAVAAVREVMGLNEPQDADDEDAYIRAVCAAVDVDQAYGGSGGIGEGLSSVTLGRFSATTTAGGSPYDADMRRAIRRELIGSSLLYQGLR